jgi:hypothetical protein
MSPRASFLFIFCNTAPPFPPVAHHERAVNWARAVGWQWKVPTRKMKKGAEGTYIRGRLWRQRQNADQLPNRNISWFFLTTELDNSLATLRNHPLLTPPQTHEGLSEARRLPCEPTEVTVTKTLSNFSQLALAATEKNQISSQPNNRGNLVDI